MNILLNFYKIKEHSAHQNICLLKDVNSAYLILQMKKQLIADREKSHSGTTILLLFAFPAECSMPIPVWLLQ